LASVEALLIQSIMKPIIDERDKQRAQISAELLRGVKPKILKEKYDVSLSTITRIKQSLGPEILDKMDRQRQNAIGDLVLTHLEMSLEGAINVIMMTEDKAWMQQQSADHLNKLYGTMTDKAIRMAETIEVTQRQFNEADEAQAQEDEVLNQDIL
jgi:Trp operon repressor